MHPAGFDPTIAASKRPQTTPQIALPSNDKLKCKQTNKQTDRRQGSIPQHLLAEH